MDFIMKTLNTLISVKKSLDNLIKEYYYVKLHISSKTR